VDPLDTQLAKSGVIPGNRSKSGSGGGQNWVQIWVWRRSEIGPILGLAVGRSVVLGVVPVWSGCGSCVVWVWFLCGLGEVLSGRRSVLCGLGGSCVVWVVPVWLVMVFPRQMVASPRTTEVFVL